MKKINVLRLVLSVTLAAFLLCGCGNSKEAPAEEAPEVAAEEEVTEENEVEEEEEEQEFVEEETSAGEEGAKEPKEEETYNGMPVAKVKITVDNFEEFLNYVDSLDNQKPALLIYNENEGYVINMGEGEYYQLKTDDRIFEYLSERYVMSSDTLEAGAGNGIKTHLFEMVPDYSQYDSPHKVIYKVFFTEDYQNGDCFRLDCYLDAPAE